jgi:hypothetical protein
LQEIFYKKKLKHFKAKYIFAVKFIGILMDKKRKIVDYSNVPEEILNMLGELYPNGYEKDVIKFPNAKGEMISAVRVETDDTIYLIKVSSQLKQMFDDLDIEEMDFSNEEKDEINDEDDDDDQYSKDKPMDDYED